MGLFKRGNVWWASVTKDGKQYRFSCKTTSKTEAQSVYARVLFELKTGNVKVVQKEEKNLYMKSFTKNILIGAKIDKPVIKLRYIF